MQEYFLINFDSSYSLTKLKKWMDFLLLCPNPLPLLPNVYISTANGVVIIV